MRSHRITLASVTALLGLLAASPAKADCDATSTTCSVGTAALKGQVTQKLATPIDSGWQGGDSIKVRTTFTIDPVAGDPLVKVDLPSGALVEATWTEKGFLDLKPITQTGQSGSLNVHYTLTPDLQAQIFGIAIHYNANQLVNMIPGASFNYDAKAAAPLLPWGFDGAQVTPQAPALDQSTIFSLPFDKLSIPANTITGTLGVQASAQPIFQYRTTQVQLDAGSIGTANGTTRVPVVDGDAIDLRAQIVGELGVAGTLQVKPNVQADTVAGHDTYGLLKYSFSVATVDISGATTPVTFDAATIHIPLPNVKVPDPAIGFGNVQGGSSANKTVTVNNTGELGATVTFESSDPQFVVSKDPVKITAKGTYALPVTFKAISGAPASATITVRSNDPDSPEQTFKVGGNGADIGENDGKDDSSSGGGCSAAPRSPAGSSLLGGLGIGLALLALVRRKR